MNEKIELSLNEDVLDAYRKLKAQHGSDVLMKIAKGSVLFENSLNLKLLRKEAVKSGKNLAFETDDEVGQNLINSLDNPSPMFVEPVGTKDSNTEDKVSLTYSETERSEKRKASIQLFKKVWFWVLLTILGSIGAGGYYLYFVLPAAKVNIIVNSQPLVRSVDASISVKNTTVDVSKRLVPGKLVSADTTVTLSQDSTGTKEVGEKAKGKVTVFNKTTSDATFKKGTSLVLVTSKESLKFVTSEEVTVPKKTVNTISDDDPITPDTYQDVYGEAEVDVVAESFGSKYNLDDDRNFKIGGKDTDDFVASNDEKFSGGTSKTVKAVSKDDLTKLSSSAFDQAKQDVVGSLRGALPSSDARLLDSAVSYKKMSETFDKKEGDQADSVSVTQTVSATGISYSSAQLQELLDGLLGELVPKDFELSDKDKSIEVGLLSLVQGEELPESLQIQVKIRAYIVPEVKEEELRGRLVGLTITDGRKILDEVQNINSYEIDLWPKVTTFFGKFPSKKENIEVEIVRQ